MAREHARIDYPLIKYISCYLFDKRSGFGALQNGVKSLLLIESLWHYLCNVKCRIVNASDTTHLRS
jgi:hypothetical protein